MNRRNFNQNFFGAAIGINTISGTPFPNIDMTSSKNPKLIKPERLREGDLIGLMAPSSSVPQRKVDQAVESLTKLGFKIQLGKSILAERGYLAGTEKQRLDDLHEMFANPAIKGIWCVRGGYGAARLLPDVDFSIIKKNPKVFIGYSDITALHVAISQATGLVTFHGPVGTTDYTPYTVKHLKATIQNPTSPYLIELCEDLKLNPSNLFKTEVITSGKATGRLTGGNLSLLSSAAGTKFGLQSLKGKLLFIEDIDERPYRVDRMLTQLLQSTDIHKASGIILGIFDGCNPKPEELSLSLIDCLKDRLGNLGIPCMYGFSFGHITSQCTLPMGIEAEMDADKGTIRFLETAVK
jgi:muramoyltetrapeptide carboxypeptidase